MASQKIIYGVMGEGRGHAKRSLTIIQELTGLCCDVLVLTSHNALDIFNQHPEIETVEIPCFKYFYRRGRINLVLGFLANIYFYICLILRKGKRYKDVKKIVTNFRPTHIITDLEPYTARIAYDLSIPLMTIDHQHALIEADIPGLSWRNKIQLSVFRIIMKRVFKPDKIIATSFYHFPKRPGSKAIFVGPIIHRG